MPDPLSQANALVRAVEEAKKQPGEGSFFGGLLEVRFSPDGLRAHVRELLTRLRSIEIEHSKHSEIDALVYVAAWHTARKLLVLTRTCWLTGVGATQWVNITGGPRLETSQHPTNGGTSSTAYHDGGNPFLDS